LNTSKLELFLAVFRARNPKRYY